MGNVNEWQSKSKGKGLAGTVIMKGITYDLRYIRYNLGLLILFCYSVKSTVVQTSSKSLPINRYNLYTIGTLDNREEYQ